MTRIAPTSGVAAYETAFASSMRALNLESAPRYLTALSGGPDSTALACLADRYARSHGKDHQAVIVNHNIRPNADSEAARVSQRMKSRGIESRVLTIEDKAPKTGIQEWARHQRFTALTKLARQQCAVLLVAHHQADQAETVLMRLAHGSGVFGLAGMRGLIKLDAVIVARPFLNWHADSLIDVLSLLGCAYEEDPSNQNSQFERVQIRKFLRDYEASGASLTDVALRLGLAMQALSNFMARASSTYWQSARRVFPTGHAMIDMDKLSDLPLPAWLYWIRQLVRQIGGRRYGVSDKALVGLYDRLLAGQNSTLGGCQFVKSERRGEPASFYVVRELGRAPEVMEVAADDDVIFAGCWRVRTKLAGKLLHAGANAKSDQAGSATQSADIATLPYVVRRAIPIIVTLDGRVIHPQLTDRELAVTSTNMVFSAQFLGYRIVG